MSAIKTIGIFARVDSGKTTLAEKILSLAGKKSSLKNNDKDLTTFDFHEIEKRRGITLFSEQATFEWKGKKINLIDTPGHSDFFYELEKSVQPLDGAILMISAAEGITSNTRRIWKTLREKHIPTLIFVNKFDQIFWETSCVEKQIREFDSRAIFVGKFQSGKYKLNLTAEEILESLAEMDVEFLEHYLSKDTPNHNTIINTMQRQVALGRAFPVIYGSATCGVGVTELIDWMAEVLPDYAKDDNGPFWGLVYRIKNDAKDGRMAYIKILSGSIGVRDTVLTGEKEEKILEIRRVNGEKYIQIARAFSGELVIVRGLEDVWDGKYIGILAPSTFEHKKGVLVTRINPVDVEKKQSFIEAVKILCDEDRSLESTFDESGEIILSVNGTTQIEVLKDILQSRFGIKASFARPIPKYMETIIGVGRGFCHYEPKKHYAEMEVEVSENPSGGNIYSSKLPYNVLPSQYQSQIEKTVNEEALLRGPSFGFPLMDVKVTLVNGRHHLEHTHGGDFRIATIRAVRSALEKCASVLLEPFYKFYIKVPEEFFGKVTTDIGKLGGLIYAQSSTENFAELSGEIPVSSSADYLSKLDIITGGHGYALLESGLYRECRDKSCIKNFGLKSSEDTLYNSVSIFREKKKMKKMKGI